MKFSLPCLRLALLAFALSLEPVSSSVAAAAEPPFAMRGYYMTFMRMPTFGLAEWKQMVDCIGQDGGNMVILWTAGAFRSKQFPITWRYNSDHANVRNDFVRELIDYAHSKQIRVLLGFTPFAYDGVNQYPLEHPELKATQKNGQPAQLWGMDSWGYNLCPSKPESQRFLREYVREMFFDFYPNADGLMIESSDYAICYCAGCGGKFFDREFEFVQAISREVWKAKPEATILVYPHYFSGRAVPGFGVTGARQPFDTRWTLFFTPHSAHIDTNLLRQAKNAIWWTEGLTLGTPNQIREGASTARQHGMTGYVPSLEPYSCSDGPPNNRGPRMKPLHFAWLHDGEMPLNELLARINRVAYREFTRNPDLSDAEFKHILAQDFFGADSKEIDGRSNGRTERSVDDALFLRECWSLEAGWFTPSILLRPKQLRERAEREKWSADRLAAYAKRIERVREIARRYETGANPAETELARVANHIVRTWDAGL